MKSTDHVTESISLDITAAARTGSQDTAPTVRKAVIERRSNVSDDTPSISIETDTEIDSPPDGGREAWSVVFGSFLGLVAVFGLVNTLGAVQSYISVHQLAAKSESQVSWIFSVFVFLSFLFSGSIGPLFDTYGPRHLCVVGSLLFVGGLVATSVCSQYYQFFLAFSVCCGTATALLMTPFVAVLGQWFDKRSGTATGLATMGGSFGGVVFPILLRSLYPRLGYANAIRTLAAITAALLVIATLLIRTRTKPVRQTSFDLHLIFDPRALRDPRFVWLCIANFLGELGVINGLTFLASYAMAAGMSPATAYALLAVLNAAGTLGRVLPGLAADALGRFNVLAATTAAAAITIFCIWLPFGKHPAGLFVFAVTHGFCNGGVYSLAPACCAQIARRGEHGRRYGTMYFLASFTVLLGVPLSASLIRGTDYTRLIVFNGAVYCGTTIAVIVSRHCAVGFGWKKW